MLSPTNGAYNVVHSAWVAASLSNHNQTLTLTTILLGGTTGAATSVSADVSNLAGLQALGGGMHLGEELSLVDSTHGWVWAGPLLSSSDGGITWTDITPRQAKGVRPAVPPASRPAGPLTNESASFDEAGSLRKQIGS